MKTHTIRLTLVGTLMAVVIATPALAGDTETADVLVDVSRIEAFDPVATDPVAADLQAWALDRNARAGLDLPEVEIHIHDDLAFCEGNFGLHLAGAGASRIDICTDPQVDPRWIILHELGHAWASFNLSDGHRVGLVAVRGLDSWNDQDALWNERGTEHAAEILAWGLAETFSLPGRIADHDLARVTEAFRFLTGTEPICDTDGPASEDPPTGADNRRGGPVA